MRAALEQSSSKRALALPGTVDVREGEWILAVFEFEVGGRATAAAGRVVVRGGQASVGFESRDWERLIEFATPWDTGAEAEEESPPSIPQDSSRQVEQSRILVVEDERISREMVTTFLLGVGLSVRAVASAEEGLEAIRTESFDLMVLDWTLPGMNGLDLCKRIRTFEAYQAIPILFLTANRSDESARQAFAAGADDYIFKPVPVLEFRARVLALLRRASVAS